MAAGSFSTSDIGELFYLIGILLKPKIINQVKKLPELVAHLDIS